MTDFLRIIQNMQEWIHGAGDGHPNPNLPENSNFLQKSVTKLLKKSNFSSQSDSLDPPLICERISFGK